MGRVWLQAATLAHTECALSVVNRGADLEKNGPNLEIARTPPKPAPNLSLAFPLFEPGMA